MSNIYDTDGNADPIIEYGRLFSSNTRWNNIEGSHLTHSDDANLNSFFEEPPLNQPSNYDSSSFLERSDASQYVSSDLKLDSSLNESDDSKSSLQYTTRPPSDYYTITNLSSGANNLCASCCQQRINPSCYFISGGNLNYPYQQQYLPSSVSAQQAHVESKTNQNGDENTQDSLSHQTQSPLPPTPSQKNCPTNLSSHRIMQTFVAPQYNGQEVLFLTPDMMRNSASNNNFSRNFINNDYGLNRVNTMRLFSQPVTNSISPISPISSISQVNGIDTLCPRPFTSNSVLVNILTCPPFSGLRNLAPAPSSSTSSMTINSVDNSSDDLSSENSQRKRKLPRNFPSLGKLKKKEARPKIFDIEEFKIGKFQLKATVNERRNYSAQLRIVFDKRRLMYEFAYTNETTELTETNGIYNSSPVIYYVISIPFEFVTGMNIESSTLYVTIDKAPYLFGGTPSKSRVLFQKQLSFDPSLGEIYNNGLHIIQIKSSQIRRLRNALTDNESKFAQMLIQQLNIETKNYVGKLPKASEVSEPKII